ncbi:hypothetical protein ACGHG0_00010, partial [Francisella tularensis subsp. novicida]
LKVTSSGGNIAQVVFNPAPQGTPNPVTISVNDEANRNCSIKAYKNNQFIELGKGNATVSYTPDSMIWSGKHMLVGYYCDDFFSNNGTDGNVTFTVDVPANGEKSITEMVRVKPSSDELDLSISNNSYGILDVGLNKALSGNSKLITVTVDDEANRNCEFEIYSSNNGAFSTLGHGKPQYSFTPPDMNSWEAGNYLFRYDCVQHRDNNNDGKVNFTVNLDELSSSIGYDLKLN